MSPTFTDVVLAFRQAKNTIASEQGIVGLIELARFEMHLATRVHRLRALLKNDRWFDGVDVGRLVVVPKSAAPTSLEHGGIVRIGGSPTSKMRLSVRLQLEPTAEFAIAEVLYLWEFGGALEAILDASCLGYRLRRVREDGVMDRNSRAVYEYWPSAFARYRDDPLAAARTALLNHKRVVVTSTDIVSFFDSIDPNFLLQNDFIESVAEASRQRARPFSQERYRTATRSLLAKFAAFRQLRGSVGGPNIDVDIGVPIGAFTSRVIANVALASVDRAIQALPHVLLYRRYVDDIVTVSTPDVRDPSPTTKATALGAIFPGFASDAPDGSTGRFTVPSTRAVFELNEEKTRVHDLAGPVGVDFLSAVERSFFVATSERRAFLGDVERIMTDFEAVDLFADGATGTDRLPRLRDADRFTLRRFLAAAYVRGLELCVLLLGAEEATDLLEKRTQRMLSTLDRSRSLEDFEFVLSLLKIALLCNCQAVVLKLQTWLDWRAGAGLTESVESVSWRGTNLPRETTLRGVAAYLRRRVGESTASACALPVSTLALTQKAAILRDASLLRRADLRHLDREDDVALFGMLAPEQTRKTKAEHAATRRAIARDASVRARLASVDSFIKRSGELGENIWTDASSMSLVLATRPPRYIDVARRFLARIESARALPPGEVGRQIDECVDALRGTRYRLRPSPPIALARKSDRTVLHVDAERDPTSVRIILSNLPVGIESFRAAAQGRPRLTLRRLTLLDRVLRQARQAARDARRKGLPSILVLPELSIPRRWVRALAEYAVREELSIVAGVEYEATTRGLVNQAMGVFPVGRRMAAMVRWTKRHPARGEESELREIGQRFRHFDGALRLVVESAHGRLGVLICSEILEAPALSTLAGQVELLLVPAWNHDTPSFEYVVHAAASMLVHTFVCVANDAEASDSRIAAPVKEPRHERDWCRLVHRGETQVIWGDLPVGELRRIHEPEIFAAYLPPAPREYRPLPPGWQRR